MSTEILNDSNQAKASDESIDSTLPIKDESFENSCNKQISYYAKTPKNEIACIALDNQNVLVENSDAGSSFDSEVTDTSISQTNDDQAKYSDIDDSAMDTIRQQVQQNQNSKSSFGMEDSLTSSYKTNSSDTDTCSEEGSLDITKDEIDNTWNNISNALNRFHKSKTPDNHDSVVTGFLLHDGSCISIDRKYLLEPIVVEVGRIVTAFMNKVKIQSEFSEMLLKSNAKENKLSTKNDTLQDLKKQCEQYEKHNLNLKHQLKEIQEKLQSHDQNAKNAISRLQKDYETKLNEYLKKCAVAESEKLSSVMNFARREKELLDLKKQKESAEQFAKNAGKEKERALTQLKQLKLDFSKLQSSHDKKEAENNTRSKEIGKLKEEINSQAIKVRWSQNKLKSEIENHKETKEKCDKMQLVIQQAKEETEQIRKNCQDMVKTYQESEEIKSNALDIELKERKEHILKLDQQLRECQSDLETKSNEIKLIKENYDNISTEKQSLTEQISNLKVEKSKSEQVVSDYEEAVNKQKATASQMNEKMQKIFDLESKIENLNETIGNLNDALHDAVVKRDAAINNASCKEKKEQELLEFTQKVSSKNTQLAVEIEQLNTKLSAQDDSLKNYVKLVDNLKSQVQELTASKEKGDQATLKNKTALNNRLEEKERTICQLLLQLEELKDELRTVKRKNAASQKDLIRQLNQVKRKADNAEAFSSSSISNSANHSADGGSMGSRTSSVTSLDRIHASSVGDSQLSHQCEHISVPETTVAGPDTLDRQMLIERIVRLQQIHAKKNEKIDFLNEHVHQLVSALQKKQRLIQHYIMREESGALAPPREHHDQKRHGLTLELSIEINRKMQSVLEDTLLKNITLKESLETMGHEVQRLQSQITSE